MFLSYVFRAYGGRSRPTILMLFHPHIKQVLSLAVFCEFLREFPLSYVSDKVKSVHRFKGTHPARFDLHMRVVPLDRP
jgi:hypothetical protein